MKLVLVAIGVLTLGCASYEPAPGESTAQSVARLEEAGLIVYRNGEVVPESDLVPLNPADFGGTILSGDVAWSGRIDYLDANGGIGGVFQATEGKFAVLYPGSCHGTLHTGRVTLTDEAGSHELRKGDSFLVKQGTYLVWDVETDMTQFSYIARPEGPDADNPSPIIVYPRGDIAPDEDFTEIDLTHFNATIIDGQPKLGVRLDHAQGTATAGAFQQLTPGTVDIDPIAVNEHGTVTHHKLTLTDAQGAAHVLAHGDSFMVKAGGSTLWGSNQRNVQGTFYGFRP